MQELRITDTWTTVRVEYERGVFVVAPADALHDAGGVFELSHSTYTVSGSFTEWNVYGWLQRKDGQGRRRGTVDALYWIKSEQQIRDDLDRAATLVAQLKADAGITEGSNR